MHRRALVVVAAVLSLAGGFHATHAGRGARAPESPPRAALLAQGLALEAAVLPPRVEVGTKERARAAPQSAPTLSSAPGALTSPRHRIVAATSPADDAKQFQRGAWAALRAPPTLT
jgi:hypothetical protein